MLSPYSCIAFSVILTAVTQHVPNDVPSVQSETSDNGHSIIDVVSDAGGAAVTAAASMDSTLQHKGEGKRDQNPKQQEHPQASTEPPRIEPGDTVRASRRRDGQWGQVTSVAGDGNTVHVSYGGGDAKKTNVKDILEVTKAESNDLKAATNALKSARTVEQAVAAAKRLDEARENDAQARRLKAAGNFSQETEKYLKDQLSRDTHYLAALRQTHGDKRDYFDKQWKQAAQKGSKETEAVRRDGNQQRQRLTSEADAKVKEKGEQGKKEDKHAKDLKVSNDELALTLEPILEVATNLRKNFSAYVEMSTERRQKEISLRNATNAMRNLTYWRLSLKEKDSKVLNNRTKAQVDALDWQHVNHTEEHSRRKTEQWQKHENGQAREKDQKSQSESIFKKARTADMEQQRKELLDDQKLLKAKMNDDHEKRKQELDKMNADRITKQKVVESGAKKEMADKNTIESQRKQEAEKHKADELAKSKKDESARQDKLTAAMAKAEADKKADDGKKEKEAKAMDEEEKKKMDKARSDHAAATGELKSQWEQWKAKQVAERATEEQEAATLPQKLKESEDKLKQLEDYYYYYFYYDKSIARNREFHGEGDKGNGHRS